MDHYYIGYIIGVVIGFIIAKFQAETSLQEDDILDYYKYTEKELKTILKAIVPLVDTREKQSHVIEWFDKKDILWKRKALTNGDYSFYLPAMPELNIDRDLYFDKEIMIERKNSVDELAGNFSEHRTRFEEELATYPGKKYLLIENSTYGDIVTGNYRSKYSAKSYLGTYHAFNHRYDIEIMFMPDNQYSGLWIYSTFMYWLREKLR